MEAQYKILMVDDEQDLELLVRQRMRREIRARKYAFLFAHDGVEALEMLGENEDIDLVLSDINMPRMDGLTLLEKIPDVDTDLRAVVISAYGDMKNIRAAMNRGAFDFVTKPIDFEDLKVTVERGLSQLEMWREAEASRDKLLTLQSELDVASSMQQSILPKRFPHNEHYELFGSMEPARNVGGDFFDVIRLEEGRLGVAIADVSDKGVPAALFMMSSRTLLKGAAVGCDDPAEAVTVVNDQLQDGNESNMFVTLFYAVFDPATGLVRYANGGHNPPLIVHRDGSSTELPLTGGVALGVAPGFEYSAAEVTLKPGEALFFYTDGVSEAENIDEEEYGMDRLQAIFADAPVVNARRTNDAVFASVREFAGDRSQFDDITCLTLLRKDKDSYEAVFRFAASHDELQKAEDRINELGERHNWSEELLFKVKLVVEEVGLNVINYGYEGDASREIEIRFRGSGGGLTIDIIDEAPAFDPLTEAPAPDTDAGIGERPVGGLGVFLVKEMMDEVSYAREDNRNRLTMTTRLAP